MGSSDFAWESASPFTVLETPAPGIPASIWKFNDRVPIRTSKKPVQEHSRTSERPKKINLRKNNCFFIMIPPP
jgi:hypothetical protein